MEWEGLKDVVSKVAPTLGGLIGGPVGATVGTLISTVLGVDNNADAVLNSLSTNPEAILKLKEIETTHKVKLEELAIEKMRLEINDLASARTRQTESEKVTGKKDYNLYFLAWTIVASYGFLIYTLINNTIPKDDTGVIYMLFGTLATAFGGVIQYFFGSSAGSKEKTIQMANMKGKL